MSENSNESKNLGTQNLKDLLADNAQAKDVLEKIKAILAENTGKDVNEISDETHIANDLGADSLTLAEIVLALESEFGVEIPDELAERITTPAEGVRALWEKLQEKEQQV